MSIDWKGFASIEMGLPSHFDGINREYTPDEIKKAEDAIWIARNHFLLKAPFFGVLAMGLDLVDSSKWLKTVSTDGKAFYYNVGFLNMLTPIGVQLCFAHVILHCAYDHFKRSDVPLSTLENLFPEEELCHEDKLLEGPETALQQQTAWRQMMLALLNRHARLPLPAKPGVEHRAVSRAKEVLQARLAEPPSLEELAAAVNLSPFHFARVFQRATGMPPHTWLMQQRIAHARALLQQGCLPLQVATQLGFADQSHLNRQFKKVYGVGPGAYRLASVGTP